MIDWQDVTARYAIDKRFYDKRKVTRFLGGTNDYDEAVAFTMQLETDGHCWYAVYDRHTHQDVFLMDAHAMAERFAPPSADALAQYAAEMFGENE